MRIAVVCNRPPVRIVNVHDARAAEITQEETAERVAQALRDAGHRSIVCEGDERLLPALRDFMPHRNSCPSGIVFNLAQGGRGECARAHVPSMLEMAAIPYTGPGPFGHSLAFDRSVVAAVLRQAGVPTLPSRVLRWPTDTVDLSFPVDVCARLTDTCFGVRQVESQEDLEAAVDEIAAIFERESFVQDRPEGIAVAAMLVGNDAEMEWLPLMQRAPGETGPSWVPAVLGSHVASALRDMACAAFGACACRDYARVDFRIEPTGNAWVTGVDSMPSLDLNGPLALAALASGRDFAALVERIVDVAHDRYFGVPAPRFDHETAGTTR